MILWLVLSLWLKFNIKTGQGVKQGVSEMKTNLFNKSDPAHVEAFKE